jgi:hypothetical protein
MPATCLKSYKPCSGKFPTAAEPQSSATVNMNPGKKYFDSRELLPDDKTTSPRASSELETGMFGRTTVTDIIATRTGQVSPQRNKNRSRPRRVQTKIERH